MEVTIKDSADVKILDFEGKLDSNSSDYAQEQLNQLLDQGVKKIVINLKKLEFIGSAGLRVLLFTQKTIIASGGEIRVCNANEQVQDIFGISGFNTILAIFNSETDALLDF